MTNRFKKGDKLRVVEGAVGDFAKGDIVECLGENENNSDMIQIKTSTKDSSGGWYKTRFVLAKNAKPKEPTYLVVWDEKQKDPCEFFTSEPEAKDFIKELSERDNVIKESIVLVEIKSCKKVAIRKSVTFAQHKI